MATAPTYCTHRQLKDVFPQVDSFDTKRPIYGWVKELEDFAGTSNVNLYYAYNTGIATQLFVDGQEMTNLSSNLDTEKTQVATEFAIGGVALAVDSSSGFGTYDVMRVDNEYMYASAITDGTTIATISSRNLFNTHAQVHAVDASVYLAADASALTSADQGWFFYDSNLDLIVLALDSDKDPNDHQVEAGEDFSTLITRITGNASRYLDAKLDPNLPREQLKDKEGNFDYIIVRTTALLAATFLIRAHDPTSEVANALMEDAQGNIDALNQGGAALSWQTTGDSSKGIIRDITYTSGSVRPVDTRGRWSGSWDLVKVSISASTAGVIGTAKYNVYVKDADGLKNNQVVTEEVITGDYQPLAGGLQIRFGGSTDASVATASNEWEVEVAGWAEEVDNSAINSVKMTRR